MNGPQEAAPRRFTCTAGGGIARGRRRLALLLGALALALVATAAAAFAHGRVGAGVIALAVALGPLVAGLLAGGSAVEYLEAAPGRITLGLRRGPETVELPAARARRLDREEIAHLEALTSAAGAVAGTGSYDSRRLGELDLYASDLANAVLVESDERRLVVTPDDPEGLCGALGAGDGGPGAAATIPPP